MKNVLGRGLSSLISTPVSVAPPAKPAVSTAVTAPIVDGGAALKIEEPSVGQSLDENTIKYLAVELIKTDPKQPRQTFNEGELLELAQSIKEKGVLQPLLVRPGKSGQYELVAGERRLRAAKLSGLSQVPVIIKDLSDSVAFEIALIENVQRANLNPVEEARAYERLHTEFKLSHEEIATKVGKSRVSITNAMRLLKLPNEVLDMLVDGSLSMGHARAILSIKDTDAQLSLARTAVRDSLSVRALESLVSQASVLDLGSRAPNGMMKQLPSRTGADGNDELSERLQRSLGTKCVVHRSSSGKGRIVIHFFSEEELGRLVDKLQ